jgi:serine/threonine protein kinase
MRDDKHTNDTPVAALDPEQVEALIRRFREACLASLKGGQPLDVSAVLRSLLEPGRDGIHRDGMSATVGLPTSATAPPAGPAATQAFHSPAETSVALAAGVASSPGHTPDSIGSYEILGVLGAGGMGVVYKACQPGLKRIVALKMIRRAEAGDRDLARFRTEAEAVAQLQHPNVVQVYEVGEDAGRPYLALEYIDGGSLKDRLQGKPQPARPAAQLVELLARAMSAAHRRGIVHRDLKPSNILLQTAEPTEKGPKEAFSTSVSSVCSVVSCLPKISDFGLAKRLEDDSGQTSSGSVLGTPSYMAPEQALGRIRDVGPLADQYALGAVLYEMVTGRPPHQGASVLETLEQVRTQDPVPPSRLQPRLPRDLETICLKCLQKEPQKRYADCAALAEDLRRFAAGEAILARPVSAPERLWRWCRRNPRVAALSGSLLALVLAILVGLALFNIRLAEEKARTEREKQAAVAAQALAEKKEQEALAQRGVALNTLGDLVTNVQAELGRVRGQQDLQKKLLGVAVASLRRVSDNPAAKISLKDSTLAAAHHGLGRLLEGLGDTEQAEAEYRLAEAGYAEQVSQDPDNPKCRGNQAIALMSLGQVGLRRRGGTPEVRECFVKAANLLATVDQGRPADQISPRAIKSLRADALRWLGVLALDTDPRQARAYYQTSLELRQDVVELTRVEALGLGAATSLGLLAAPLGQGPWLALAVPVAAGSQVDDARRDLAAWYLRVGGADLKLRNPESTRGLYLKALALSQEMAEAHPDDPAALWSLAAAHERLGDLYLRTGRPQLAGPEYEAAARGFRDLVRRDPRRSSYQDDLSRILYSTGLAAQRRGEQSLADKEYRASLQIREARARGTSDVGPQKDLMISLARCGDHRRAAEIARRVWEQGGKDLGNFIDIACCFAICSDMVTPSQPAGGPAAEQGRLRELYAQQALDALRAAVALGYRDVVNLETEPDLDAVRDRPQFAAMLDGLNRPRQK